MCCCAKGRKEGDDNTMGTMESKLKTANRILIEFITEESKIGLKDISYVDLIGRVLVSANKNELPKKELIAVYKQIDNVNQHVIKNYLIQDFFFTDNTRTKYDVTKITLYNLLYSGGNDAEKSKFLFTLIESPNNSCVQNHSPKLLTCIEYLTTIPCILVGEIINSGRRFNTDSDEQEFEELF